jgi:hypothetical protein
MWRELFSAVKALDFGRIEQVLSGVDVLSFLMDPYVLAAIAVIAIVMLVKGMEKAVVTFLSVPALLVIFEFTVRGDIDLERSGDKLLYFTGGFVAIAAINVYVHFIRS